MPNGLDVVRPLGVTRFPRLLASSLVIAIVGMQSGDEGKGRVVDLIATQANMVIRFQGGDNAGHTVYPPGFPEGNNKFALHMVPSGIFNPETICIVGPGCVANPDNLWVELEDLRSRGIDVTNFFIDARAHAVMPWHTEIDAAREATGKNGIGTTKRGIGPAYEHQMSRKGALRWGDLMEMDDVRSWWQENRVRIHRWLRSVGSARRFTVSEILEIFSLARQRFHDIVRDTSPMIEEMMKDLSKVILLEGQLGIMRDINWGTYPYVTASSPHIGGVAGGAGIPATRVTRRIGVAKAYMTCVGAGPFPTELLEGDPDGDAMSEIGKEFGATTERRRRCGWLDIPVLKLAVRINDPTEVALTKLDVLDTFERIRVCIGYRLRDGTVVTTIPTSVDGYNAVQPVYMEFDGWQCNTTDCRRWEDLPKKAKAYIRFIERELGVPITMISVGPNRDAMILHDRDYGGY